FFFSLTFRLPPISTLFPYTTLFRSINKYRDLIANNSIKRVVIENQASKFPKMKSIQTALITFYIMNGFKSSQIITQSAMKKFDRSEEQRLNSSHVKISYAVFCLKKK